MNRLEEAKKELKEAESAPRRVDSAGEPDEVSAAMRSARESELAGEIRGLEGCE